jgi:hypothetical protein
MNTFLDGKESLKDVVEDVREALRTCISGDSELVPYLNERR